jgi:hypothetical protein
MNEDLDAALAFVTARIEEEAVQSGEPLSPEERFLLQYLPKHSAMPLSPDAETPALLPRDLAYDKLCALAKSSNRSDVARDAGSAKNWEFSAAVSKLNRHPMAWLLDWAGVKVRKPWWDDWLLLFAALLFIAIGIVPLVLAGDEPWSPTRWIIMGSGYIVTLLLMYFGSRRIEEWQLRQTIERCRANSNTSFPK